MHWVSIDTALPSALQLLVCKLLVSCLGFINRVLSTRFGCRGIERSPICGKDARRPCWKEETVRVEERLTPAQSQGAGGV